jgi:hypothetical protein
MEKSARKLENTSFSPLFLENFLAMLLTPVDGISKHLSISSPFKHLESCDVMPVSADLVSNDANRKGACLSDSLSSPLSTSKSRSDMLKNQMVRDFLLADPAGELTVEKDDAVGVTE